VTNRYAAVRKSELPALTGIRFYAALFVYLSHLPDVIPGMGDLAAPYLVFNAGVVSVSLFFLLSGFVLTYNYAEWFTTGVAKSLYIRFVWDRLAKIYPVHFFTMLLVSPIAILSPHHPFDWRAVPFHVLLLQCWWPLPMPEFREYLNVPSWSISCEWFFYLLAPGALFFALGSVRRLTILVGAALTYAGCLGLAVTNGQPASSQLYYVSWFAPSRFVEFLVGVILARLFLFGTTAKIKALTGRLQAAGIALIVTGAVARAHAPWPFWGGLLYVPGSALLVISLAHGGGLFAAHLSRPAMSKLGAASFSFYMVHAPILRIIKNICLFIGWRVQSWPSFWLMTFGLLIVTQVAALLLHQKYEKPLQRLLRGLLEAPAVGWRRLDIDVPGIQANGNI
jgi:peptidoglycan/LPS O-acetylase OafA/YrhL